MPLAHSRRVYSIFTQLPDLLERIKTLEERVKEQSPKQEPPVPYAQANRTGGANPDFLELPYFGSFVRLFSLPHMPSPT